MDHNDQTRPRTEPETPGTKTQAQDGPTPATGPQPQSAYSEAAKKSLDEAKKSDPTRD